MYDSPTTKLKALPAAKAFLILLDRAGIRPCNNAKQCHPTVKLPRLQ